ncbi:MAG: YraN family protein [Patescibacteria group bacterium]
MYKRHKNTLKKDIKRKNSKEKGFIAERYAADYLKSKGFEVLDFNIKEGHGEVDILAKKEKILHFVEVKSSYSKKAEKVFLPENRVDRSKIENIARVAESYLERKGREDDPWCIDIVSVLFSSEEDIPEVEMKENIIL